MSSSIYIDKSLRSKIYDGIDLISGYGQLITDKEARVLKLMFRNQLNSAGDHFENIFKELCNKKIAFNKKIHCSTRTVTNAFKKLIKLNIIDVNINKSKGNVRHLKINLDKLKSYLPTFEETEQKIEKNIQESPELKPIEKKYKKAKESIYQNDVINYISKKKINFPKGIFKRFNIKQEFTHANNNHLLKFYYSVNICDYCTKTIDYSDLKISSEEIKKDKLDTYIQNTWTRALVRINDLWIKEIANYPKIQKEELLHEILRQAIETGGRVEALPAKAKTV